MWRKRSERELAFGKQPVMVVVVVVTVTFDTS